MRTRIIIYLVFAAFVLGFTGGLALVQHQVEEANREKRDYYLDLLAVTQRDYKKELEDHLILLKAVNAILKHRREENLTPQDELHWQLCPAI